VDASERQIRRLWKQLRLTPFPDCRGAVVDGVDLVLIDDDLTGSVRHFVIGPRSGGNDLQLLTLNETANDLTRILPRLVGKAAAYFDLNRKLADATLHYLHRPANPLNRLRPWPTPREPAAPRRAPRSALPRPARCGWSRWNRSVPSPPSRRTDSGDPRRR